MGWMRYGQGVTLFISLTWYLFSVRSYPPVRVSWGGLGQERAGHPYGSGRAVFGGPGQDKQATGGQSWHTYRAPQPGSL